MSANHEDLRVIKTKRGFREAFIRLLLEKNYDAISIKDIADEAETARVTFYRHYKNKEELLIDCIDMIYERFTENLKPVSDGEFQQGYSPMLAFYEQIERDGKIYRLLSTSRAGQFLINRLTELLAERTQSQLEARFPADRLLAPMEIIAYHIASAQIALANWWIENDQPYSSEYMAKISFWLSMAGNLHGIGIDNVPLTPPSLPETKSRT